MTLIKCPECNKQISDAAFFCPGCGFPIKKQTTPTGKRKPGRRGNGLGTVYCLHGQRRNPWIASITVGWEIDEKTGRSKQKQRAIGYYPTEAKATAALEKYLEHPYDLDKKSTTIEQLYKLWSKEYFNELSGVSSTRTITAAWEYVPQYFKLQTASTVTPQAIKSMINNDTQRITENGNTIKASPNTKARIKSIFNLMFDYAVLASLTQFNPSRQFSLKGIQSKIEKRRTDKIPITIQHEKELWNDLDYGYTRMVLINIYSGWRPKELIKLKKEDIDLDNEVMTGGMKTAAGFNRMVPIHPKILPLIRYYFDKSSGEYLFYDYDKPNPTTLTYDKYRARFNKILVRHDWLSLYSPSCPRHTFSTRAKQAHMDELARKSIMGHEITDVTDKHYTHMDMRKYLMTELKKIP